MKRIFAHIGFSFAVSLIILNFLSIEWALAATAAAGVLLIFSLAYSKTRRAGAVPLCLLSALLACVEFFTFYCTAVLPQQELDGKTVAARIYCVDLEKRTSSGYRYTVKTESVELGGAPQNIKLTLYSDERIYADYYEVLQADITLFSAGENAYSSAGSFGNGIYLRGYMNHYTLTGDKVKSANKYALDLRSALNQAFQEIMPGDEGALSLAVLTGYTDNLSNEVYSNFKACGATHLMAVSGFNLAVISGSLYKLLRRLLAPRAFCVAVCSAGVVLYVMLAGFSKSMVRSAVMMLVFLFAKLIKERSDALNSLGLAAFLVCLNPYAVADAGALLTFTAVLGLSAVSPKLKIRVRRGGRIAKSIADSFTASVSVFITTFPVMYFIFGSASVSGIFLNIILIPLTELLLISSLLFSLLLFAPAAALVFANINFYISAALITITRVCARIPYAVLNIGGEQFGIIIACTLFIFGTGFAVKNKGFSQVFKWCAGLSCFICAAVLAVSSVLSAGNIYVRVMHGEYSNSVIIYDSSYAAVINTCEYSQFYKAENIIAANGLETVMISEGSREYSLMLAQSTDCLNYAAAAGSVYSGREISDYNILFGEIPPSRLWSNVSVDFTAAGEGRGVKAVIYGTEFDFSPSALANAEKCDIIYTVNKNGYSVKGVNEWAE